MRSRQGSARPRERLRAAGAAAGAKVAGAASAAAASAAPSGPAAPAAAPAAAGAAGRDAASAAANGAAAGVWPGFAAARAAVGPCRTRPQWLCRRTLGGRVRVASRRCRGAARGGGNGAAPPAARRGAAVARPARRRRLQHRALRSACRCRPAAGCHWMDQRGLGPHRRRAAARTAALRDRTGDRRA
eukprot:362448-Chlamydomonas_euryale.AAC.2